MKKKIKELTIADFKNICSTHKTCRECPLGKLNVCVLSPYMINDSILDKEIYL